MARTVDFEEGRRIREYVNSRKAEIGYSINDIKYKKDGSVKTTNTSLSFGHGKKFLDTYGRIDEVRICIKNDSTCPEYKAVKELIEKNHYREKRADQGPLYYTFFIPTDHIEMVLKLMLDARKAYGQSDL